MAADLFTLFRRCGAASSASVFAIRASEIAKDDRRLEAAYYGSKGYQSLRSVATSGFRLSSIGEVATVRQPPIFKRCYVEDAQHGVPYLNGIQLMEARPRPDTFLSRTQTAVLAELVLQAGMVVILDAGQNAGETVIFATKDVEDLATTNNTIRIIGSLNGFSSELLYAYLLTPAGNFALTRTKYGSSIPHIEPRHVESIMVPCLPVRLRSEVTRLVKYAANARVKANALLRKADEYLWQQAGIDSRLRGALSNSTYETGVVDSARLYTSYEGESRIRLEATFQDVSARGIETQIQKNKAWARLRQVVEAIPYTGPGSMPGVPKVEQGSGIPTVTGRDLAQTHLKPAYYLSTSNARVIEKLRPLPGTTFVMCAGTPGKTEYVRCNYESWFVSLDVIRVIPDSSKLHPGYVYAFLSSVLGQRQMLRHRYGSVIPRIHSRQVAEVCIPVPHDRGEATGEFVNEAFDLRAEAREMDSRAIQLVQTAIERGRKLIEAEWGAEY